MSLDYLSDLRRQRALLMGQLGSGLVGRVVPRVVDLKAVAKSSKSKNLNAIKNKVLVMTATDFVARRNLLFSKKKFTLSMATPAFLIFSHNKPYFVVFYPKYLKEAHQEQMLSTYQKLGQMESDKKIPTNIKNFISTYKLGRSKGLFLNYSLTDFTMANGFRVLRESYDKKKPVLVTQLRSTGNDLQMILIPVIK